MPQLTGGQAREHQKLGMKQYREGKYAEALSSFDKVGSLHPFFPIIYILSAPRDDLDRPHGCDDVMDVMDVNRLIEVSEL